MKVGKGCSKRRKEGCKQSTSKRDRGKHDQVEPACLRHKQNRKRPGLDLRVTDADGRMRQRCEVDDRPRRDATKTRRRRKSLSTFFAKSVEVECQLGEEVRSTRKGALSQYLNTLYPAAERLETVDVCLEHVRILVRQLRGNDDAIIVQGSYAQGLAVGASDLDVAIVPAGMQMRGGTKGCRSEGPGINPQSSDPGRCKKDAVALLRRLAVAIDTLESSDLKVVQRIFSAKVPVLRLHGSSEMTNGQRSGRVIIDVSVGGSLLRGAGDRCLHRLLHTDRTGVSAGLCRLLKVWAKRRGISNTLRGGLSSFALVLLAAFHRQHVTLARLPCYETLSRTAPNAGLDGSCAKQHEAPQNGQEEALAEALHSFFSWVIANLPFFGEHALSLMSGRWEPRPETADVWRPLWVNVPFEPGQNAARCLWPKVWKSKICPEFERARDLASKIACSSGRDRFAAIRSLFAASGAKQEHLEGNHPVDGAGTGGSDDSADSGSQVHRRKRRKSANTDKWLNELLATRSPPLASLTLPQPVTDEIPPIVQPPPVSCAVDVERFLGLRAALSGG